jgi:hypothetical protein
MKKILALCGVLSLTLAVNVVQAAPPCGPTDLGTIYVQFVQGDHRAKAKLVNEASRLGRCLDRHGLLTANGEIKGSLGPILEVLEIAKGLDRLHVSTPEEVERFTRMIEMGGPNDRFATAP